MAGAVVVPGWREVRAARVEWAEEEVVIVEGERVKCVDSILGCVEVVKGSLYSPYSQLSAF